MRCSNLEARVGIRLLNRTTRSVSLTDAGAMLLAQLSPAFADIGAALDALNQFRDTPFGKVRINVPNSIAPFVRRSGDRTAGRGQPESRARDRRHRPPRRHRRGRLRRRHPAGREPARRHDRGADQAAPAPGRGRLAGLFRHRGRRRAPRATSKAHVGDRRTCIRTACRYAWEFRKGEEAIAYWPTGPIALDDHELMVQAALSRASALAYVWEDRARRPMLAAGGWCAASTTGARPRTGSTSTIRAAGTSSAGLRAVIAMSGRGHR